LHVGYTEPAPTVTVPALGEVEPRQVEAVELRARRVTGHHRAGVLGQQGRRGTLAEPAGLRSLARSGRQRHRADNRSRACVHSRQFAEPDSFAVSKLSLRVSFIWDNIGD
jgi:hypothetical protein